jgi:hypothetical protein
VLSAFLDRTDGSVADFGSRIFTIMRGYHIIIIDGINRRGNNVQARPIATRLRRLLTKCETRGKQTRRGAKNNTTPMTIASS